jgi:hypothetical protein
MSMYNEYVVARKNYGLPPVVALQDVPNLLIVEPIEGCLTRIVSLIARAGTVPQTVTVMRPLNMTTFAADAAAGAGTVVLTADPGIYPVGSRVGNNAIGPNDFIVYECGPDGRTYQYGVGFAGATFSAFLLGSPTSTSGTPGNAAVSAPYNVPTGGVKAGKRVWYYGIPSDTNPNDAFVHPFYNLPAIPGAANYGALARLQVGRNSGITTIRDAPGFNLGNGVGQPILIYHSNQAPAGLLESVGVEYVRKAI